jgi:hypothetical protein
MSGRQRVILPYANLWVSPTLSGFVIGPSFVRLSPV